MAGVGTIDIATEIETLIRARYPILYLVTAEETRVQEVLLEIGARRKKKVFEWSCSTGVIPAGSSIQLARHRQTATRDPAVALDQVIDQVEPAVFMFKDLHPFLNRNEHLVIRKLKEIAIQLKNSYKTIVIVSPVLDIPPELEKEITVLNFPLPSRDDLEALLARIVEEVVQYEHITIDLDGESRERLLQAALGLTRNEAENVFARILVKHDRISGEDVQEVFAEKQQIIRKSGLLEYHDPNETLAQVGGLEVLKGWVRKRSLAFTAEARAFGLPAPRGMLLLGVQGCGKSLMAKAVSSLWQLPLLRFDVGRMFGSYVGSSEENMRRAIAVTESVAPVVLWVDEIDKALAGSQSSGIADGGTTSRVFGTFLTWLSEKTAPVFVVATANDIGQLPAELLRKGRFDEIFFIDLPRAKEREEILKVHLRARHREPAQFDLARLSAASDGFSGAELEQVIIGALFDAFAEGTELNTELMLHEISQTVPLAKTMDESVGRLRKWAEGRARLATAAG